MLFEEAEHPITEDAEAAFYGPKVDINAKNVYGKEDRSSRLLANSSICTISTKTATRKFHASSIVHPWDAMKEHLHIQKCKDASDMAVSGAKFALIPISEKFSCLRRQREAQMKKQHPVAPLTDVPKRWATRSVKSTSGNSIHALAWCKRRGRGQGFRKEAVTLVMKE